jgi:hypothetical protein
LLVELDDSALGIGSQLRCGGAEGVGRLQGMTPLHPAAAMTALADMDVESPVNWLAGDLNLELLGDVGLVERPATVGQVSGEGASWVSSIWSGRGGWRWALAP